MIYAIENEQLRAEIHDLGAELRGLLDKRDNRQLMWSGDAQIWGGVSPLLFPIVGKLKGDRFTYRGTQYEMPTHGFARKMIFAPVVVEKDRIELMIESDADTSGMYPFEFALFVSYQLEGARIEVSFRVENRTDGEMWFSIGAHPGIACGRYGRIEFEEAEAPRAYRLTADHLLPDEMSDLPIEGHIWQLDDHTFDEDAYILAKTKSKAVTVASADGQARVKVRYGKAPYLGIWAKPGAPYVCIEPWFGVDDPTWDVKELPGKPGIVGLAVGDRFEYAYTMERV